MKLIFKILTLLMLAVVPMAAAQEDAGVRQAPKKESPVKALDLYIAKGNKLMKSSDYAGAAEQFRKAAELDPASEIAKYNLATALALQIQKAGDEYCKEATELFTDLEQNAKNPSVLERASYNLGNIAFNNKNYKEAIKSYKQSLRINPDNDLTRENLRLAQKMKDENNDQNKNQDQQQDKKEDKKDQDKKDQDNKDQQQPPQQPQQPEISDANAEQILNAMQKAENETRKRVQEVPARRPTHGKPW